MHKSRTGAGYERTNIHTRFQVLCQCSLCLQCSHLQRTLEIECDCTQHRVAQRIPDTDTNPVAFQLKESSPDYWLFNGQITRVFNKNFEIYVGVENVGNYKQDTGDHRC